MDPWITPALSVVSGFLGNKSKKLPKEVKNIMRFQYSIADQMRRMAQQTPLSAREDQWALADAQARLGEQQKSQREQIYSAYNPETDAQSRSQLMMNVTNEQIGQRMALESQHLMAALANRRQMYGEAARIAAGSTPSANLYGAHEGGGSNLAVAFGTLAQQLAKQEESRIQNNQQRPRSQVDLDGGYRASSDIGDMPQTPPVSGGGQVPVSGEEILRSQHATGPSLWGQVFGGGGGGGGGTAPLQPGLPGTLPPMQGLPQSPFYGGGGGIFQGPAMGWGQQAGIMATQGFGRKHI